MGVCALCKSILNTMSDVTHILDLINQGDPSAADQLLPLVYDELRRLATHRLRGEAAGQTLQPTALVHEAYVRLVDQETVQEWDSRGHFFAAAAEAMRRIMVEKARRKGRQKHGGGLNEVEFYENVAVDEKQLDRFLDLNDAIGALEQHDAQAAALVKLRYFVGFSHQEAADSLGISRGTADRLWAVARAWLKTQL